MCETESHNLRTGLHVYTKDAMRCVRMKYFKETKNTIEKTALEALRPELEYRLSHM